MITGEGRAPGRRIRVLVTAAAAVAVVWSASAQAAWRFAGATWAAPGTAELAPIAKLPSPVLAVGLRPEQQGALVLEFERTGPAEGERAAILTFAMRQGGPASATRGAALDLYLLVDAATLAQRGAGMVSLGSTALRFKEQLTGARFDLTASYGRFAGQGKVRFLVVPVGDAQRSASVMLAVEPKLQVSPVVPGGEARQAQLLRPLWRGEETTEEPVIFHEVADGEPRAKLLHKPRAIERVFSYATGREYREGVDWRLDGEGHLRALKGGKLPVAKDGELYPAHPAKDQKFRQTSDGRNLLIVETTWSYPLTVHVNYRHDDDWRGPVPPGAGGALARTRRKLEQREPVKMVFIGDSITTANIGTAAGMLSPYGASWPEQFAGMLRRRFGGPIEIKDRAVGGTVSSAGRTNADTLVAPERPDLVVVAYGMNDQWRATPAEFSANLAGVIQQVAAVSPDTEFILVSSMVPNPQVDAQPRLLAYRDELAKLTSPRVAVADLTGPTRYIASRKDFIDVSANNFNHPNDFLVRCYAQTVAALLTNQ